MNSTEQNSQTQAPKKKERDWIVLIIVPIAVAAVGSVVGGVITYINAQTQANIADEKRQDDVLSKYIEDMKVFLQDEAPPGKETLDKTSSLPQSKPSNTIARALTMTALSQLTSQGQLGAWWFFPSWFVEDPKSRNLRSPRRKWVIRFVLESKLIDIQIDNIGFLQGGADLHEANLKDLKILKRVNLKKVNLKGVNLKDADLTRAILKDADLIGADLKDAVLTDATLSNVDLSGAHNLTLKQLEGEHPPLLCHVTLPEGFPDKLGDRDCKNDKTSNISAVPASPASSSYPDLEEWLASKSWEEANGYTFKLIRDAHPSGEGVTKAAIDQFPCQNLKDIDQLWVHYSKGAFGFSIQKKILESAGHKLVALDPQNAINAYHRLALQVGWKNSNVWKNVPDFRLGLDAPRGHLPRIEFTVDKQGQPNNTLVPFDILLRAETTCPL